jgi:hypothetical protein
MAYVLYGLLFPFAMFLMTRLVPSTAAVDTSKIPCMGLIKGWVILSVMFFAYRLVQALIRFRPFNYLFAGLSLTRLHIWRRFLAPRVTVRGFGSNSAKKDRGADLFYRAGRLASSCPVTFSPSRGSVHPAMPTAKRPDCWRRTPL